jgi:hypothetical protein
MAVKIVVILDWSIQQPSRGFRTLLHLRYHDNSILVIIINITIATHISDSQIIDCYYCSSYFRKAAENANDEARNQRDCLGDSIDEYDKDFAYQN